MGAISKAHTRVTLLGRLKAAPEDPDAWRLFVDFYAPHVYAWCRAWGLQESDAQDVTQDVFLSLSGHMKDFAYDPGGSFRAWLKTVTRRIWHAYAKRQKRAGRGAGSDAAAELLSNLVAREDLDQRLEQAFDQELLKEAFALVRLRVEPRTWKAFELLAMQGLSGAEVGAKLEMKVATVFVSRSKVQRMLREELARLESR